MWTCEYSKEPVDYKLIGLRFIRKIWLLPLAILVGILVVGSCYYYAKIIAKGGRTYQTESIFYVDYAENLEGKQFDYYNYFTWGEVIHTDFFMDGILEKLQGEIERTRLEQYVSATVESDARYLYVRCNTHTPELSLKLAGILEKVVPLFSDSKEEIQSIRLDKAAREATDSSKLWMGNAYLLGGLLGLAAAVFGILIWLITDSAVYIPSTLEKRYHIPCLGTSVMEEFSTNCEYFLKEAKQIAIVPVDKESIDGALFENIALSEQTEVILCKNPIECPEEWKRICECQKVVLVVRAAKKNSKQLERVLEQLLRMDINVTATVLVHVNERLLRAYYRS